MAIKKSMKLNKSKSNKNKTNKSTKKSNKNKTIKGGEILTYEQNSYNNDPQYSQLDTRHMFSEQTKPMLGGKKTKRNLRKRMKGGKMDTGYLTNLLNSDGGFNTSSMQNLQSNNIV